MAAPDYVPIKPTEKVRTYASPPRRNRSWMADRPGDLRSGQPVGERLGAPGPDQGYALRLAGHFTDRLRTGSLDVDDVIAGCVAVANKRAALFGRAPVVHDLTVAFTLWGFLDEAPAPDLVAVREQLFPQVASAHHYAERRQIADLAAAEALQRPHAAIVDDYRQDWRSNLTLD